MSEEIPSKPAEENTIQQNSNEDSVLEGLMSTLLKVYII